MAALRSKRHNAGKNIGKLLDQELDADDFYKTAYGGFEDTLEDGVYQSEDSDDDEVDSDFDAPEQEGYYYYLVCGIGPPKDCTESKACSKVLSQPEWNPSQ